MKNRIKIIVAISAVVLLAAGCGKVQAPQADEQISPSANQQQATTSGNQAVTPKGQTTTRDNPNSPDFFPNGQNPGGVSKASTVNVTQTVEGSNLNKLADVLPAGENAIDLLKLDHTVETQNYSGIGDFVTSIDGNKADIKHFWEFFVNGKSSNIGASSYVLKAGDKIEWKLSAISSSGQ